MPVLKLPERHEELMIHDSINKNCGSYFKYSRYGVFTLLVLYINLSRDTQLVWLHFNLKGVISLNRSQF